MHRADITTMLSDMCAQQLLESYGYGRGTKYHVYGIKVATFDGKVATSGGKVATSDGKVATSDGKVATSDGKVATSDGKVATSDGKVATSDGKVATSKRRMSREELMNMILEVCDEWRTLDEICVLVGKNSKYLRNRVIPQMSDILEKMYENIPNHPRQKYRARQKEE